MDFKKLIWLNKNGDTFSGKCSECYETIDFVNSLILLNNKRLRGSMNSADYNFICYNCDRSVYLNIEKDFSLTNSFKNLNVNDSNELSFQLNKSLEEIIKSYDDEDDEYVTTSDIHDRWVKIENCKKVNVNDIREPSYQLNKSLDEVIKYFKCEGDECVIISEINDYDGLVKIAKWKNHKMMIDIVNIKSTRLAICVGLINNNEDYVPLPFDFICNIIKKYILQINIDNYLYNVVFYLD